jgi:D-alanine transfer protein
MQRHNYFRFHVLPFMCALAIVCLLYFIPPARKMFFPFDAPQNLPPAHSGVFYSNIQHYSAELRVRTALHTGGIVVMGSSELARGQLRAIPYNFFGKELGFPCIGIGFGGNQSFSIAMQLAAMHEDLTNAKLVIMLSPSWFMGKVGAQGTDPSAFLEFSPERFLYRGWFDPDVPQAFRDELGDYVAEHYKTFSSPSSILRLIYYSHRARLNPVRSAFDAPFIALNSSATAVKQSIMDKLYDRKLASAPLGIRHLPEDTPAQQVGSPAVPPEPDWDQLTAEALKRFAERSNKNPYAVTDKIFEEVFLKAKEITIPVKVIKPEDNKEYQQFLFLLSLLQHYHLKPLFVIQPLNPFLYPGLPDLDPTIMAIENELRKADFSYLNLYTSDQGMYVKGTLLDSSHLADYGWLLVDRSIYKYFFAPRMT